MDYSCPPIICTYTMHSHVYQNCRIILVSCVSYSHLIWKLHSSLMPLYPDNQLEHWPCCQVHHHQTEISEVKIKGSSQSVLLYMVVSSSTMIQMVECILSSLWNGCGGICEYNDRASRSPSPVSYCILHNSHLYPAYEVV